VELDSGEQEKRTMPAARMLAPPVRRRSGRTRYGDLQREAQRRRHAANQTMVYSLVGLVALVVLFYKVLSR
jgi:hypothetical protein